MTLVRSRGARILAALLVLLALGTLLPLRNAPLPPFVHEATIRFDPVPLDASSPRRIRLGALTYLAGWRLSSSNPRFGGISAMHVENGRVTALSDNGRVFRFPLPQHGSKVFGRIDPLADGPGSPRDKKDRDTEALALADGQAWIAYERRDTVWRYRTSDWRGLSHAEPAPMRPWPNNAGAEALVRLADGRFLLMSEGGRMKDGGREALLFDGDPAVPGAALARLSYRPPSGYLPTDAGELPDGRLLILNRRVSPWDGLSAKLVVARLPAAGTKLIGRELATLRAPLAVDNMEALAVTREGGRTIVWIASDDNFSAPLQRTLLLKFALN